MAVAPTPPLAASCATAAEAAISSIRPRAKGADTEVGIPRAPGKADRAGMTSPSLPQGKLRRGHPLAGCDPSPSSRLAGLHDALAQSLHRCQASVLPIEHQGEAHRYRRPTRSSKDKAYLSLRAKTFVIQDRAALAYPQFIIDPN